MDKTKPTVFLRRAWKIVQDLQYSILIMKASDGDKLQQNLIGFYVNEFGLGKPF